MYSFSPPFSFGHCSYTIAYELYQTYVYALWLLGRLTLGPFVGFDCLEDLIILKDILEHFMTESQQNKSQQFFY
jgi:hypothetical protein